MEEYKQKLLEAEEKTQNLLSVLENLKSKADELNDAKIHLSESTSSLSKLCEITQENVKALEELNKYAKEVNIASLMDYISSVQNTQKNLQTEIQKQLMSIESSLVIVDEIKSQMTDSFNKIEISLQENTSEVSSLKSDIVSSLKSDIDSLFSSSRAIKTFSLVNLLILIFVGSLTLYQLFK